MKDIVGKIPVESILVNRQEYINKYHKVASTEDLMNQLNQIKNTGDFNSLSSEQRQELVLMLARFKVELVRTRGFRISGGENRTVDLITVPKEEGNEYGTNIISKTDLKIELYDYLKRNNLIEPQRNGLGGNYEFNRLFNQEVLRLNDEINNTEREDENLTPEKPTPEKPTPEKPTPEKPTPEKPTPEKPTPGNPTVSDSEKINYVRGKIRGIFF